ncbi:MAG: M23 family metallopeptidase [Candidatus Dormibacteria bacterium]
MPLITVAAALPALPGRRGGAVVAGCLAIACAPAMALAMGLVLLTAVLDGVSGAGALRGSTAAARCPPAPDVDAPCGGGPVVVPVGTPMTCPGLAVARGFQMPIHAGIDLDCPAGTPVLATAEGVVRRREDHGGSCSLGGLVRAGGYGTLVVLEPVGTETIRALYGHLSGVAVSDGAHVPAGAVIGYEGSTGCSTGPHLHFEIRVRGVPVNPCPFVSEGYPSVAWHSAGCPLHLL